MFGPNITGILGGAISDGTNGTSNGKVNAQGAFALNPDYDSKATVGVVNAWKSKGVTFNASMDEPIFGSSSTVQPLAFLFLPCIKS